MDGDDDPMFGDRTPTAWGVLAILILGAAAMGPLAYGGLPRFDRAWGETFAVLASAIAQVLVVVFASRAIRQSQREHGGLDRIRGSSGARSDRDGGPSQGVRLLSDHADAGVRTARTVAAARRADQPGGSPPEFGSLT